MNVNFTDRTVQYAARWYARLQAADCTASDREEFARWCAADPANAAAYAAARDMAARLTRVAATNPRLQAMAAKALAAKPDGVAAVPSRARRGLGVAAALAVGVVAMFGAARMLQPPAAPSVHETISHVATQDRTRVLTLDDGTIVHVDVSSELEVRFSARQRDVVLAHGRAVFDVAHDAARPFVVAAGDDRVTAVGTRFQVARTPGAVVVTLAEGVVTVSGALGGTQRTERLLPGDELSINAGDRANDEAWVVRSVDPRVVTSWSVGRLVFRETRLGEALREVNRYAEAKVRLADLSLEDLPVSGNFVAGDSKAVVAAFAAVLPLRIADGGDELLLYRLEDAHH
jgi:transmembrane sensor